MFLLREFMVYIEVGIGKDAEVFTKAQVLSQLVMVGKSGYQFLVEQLNLK